MAITASRALIRQTERWFVRRGVPFMISGYAFSQHMLPRMVPFLAFVAISTLTWLISVDDPREGWTLRGVALAIGIVVWIVLAIFGRRLPYFTRWVSWAVLAAYALLPLVVPLLMLALHGRDAAEDVLGVESTRSPWAFYLAAVGTLATAYGLLAVAAWLITAYGVLPLTRRALGQAWRDMRNSVRLQGRALPTLLFVTLFFFFTGELWQAMNRLAWWRLALVLALFAAVTVLAAAARLRDEIGRVEHDLSPERLEHACAGTPLEEVSIAEVTGPDRPLTAVPLSNREAANLLLVLATRQLVQACVVGLGLFGFFLVLGIAVVTDETAAQWIGAEPQPAVLLPGLPVALLRNAALLAGFGSMYFAVISMSDNEYRQQFFAPIIDEVEQTLAVRAVYLAVRAVVVPEPPHAPAAPFTATAG